MDIKQAFLDGHKIKITYWPSKQYIYLDKDGLVRDDRDNGYADKRQILNWIDLSQNWELFQKPVKIHDLWI
jgi:hypothetical protein